MDDTEIQQLKRVLAENTDAIERNRQAIERLNLNLTRIFVLFDALGQVARQSVPGSVEGPAVSSAGLRAL